MGKASCQGSFQDIRLICEEMKTAPQRNDIVICVSFKDCLIVKKNVKFLKRNCSPRHIYIITSRSNFVFFSPEFCTRYGVVPVDENEIAGNRAALEKAARNHFTCKYRFGWYYQQFLKMGFAESRYADEFYVIWDADTFPLNPVRFFDEGGKLLFTRKSEYHKAYFKTLGRLFGYRKNVPYSFIAEHMPVDVQIMREIIGKISSSAIPGDSWMEKIINATPADDPNAFSEFETYGTWCSHNYPGRYGVRELRTFREGGMYFSRLVRSSTLMRLSEDYDTISIEAWSRPQCFSVRLCNILEIIKVHLYAISRGRL